MRIIPVKTRILYPPRDELLGAIREFLPALREKSILAITSKVISIWQGRCIARNKVRNKDALIRLEADKYLPRNLTPHGWTLHTLKNNLLIPAAGIDESNGNGYYVLWPQNPKKAAKEIWRRLRRTYKIKNLGVIITDSHSIPLRRGVVGISLAHCGFQPLKYYRGAKDLFGRPVVMEQCNIPDALAAGAVLAMGEGGESTPLAVIEDIPSIRFASRPMRLRRRFSSFEVNMKEDLFAPFLNRVPWKK
jgi:putative folate metabolism gamma-glutamate ligase